MKPMKLTSYELAKQLRVPAPRIHDIVLEKCGITADTAVRLAKFFGTSEQFWMNLQTSYEVRKTRTQLAHSLRLIQPIRVRTAA
jgi:addiction module HigA family antidote